MAIKEFGALLDRKRNKTKEDPKGLKLERAFRELTYIYLTCDWQSPYSEWSDQEKHDAAVLDSELTNTELEDTIFLEAKKKYLSLQDSRTMRLLNSAFRACDELQVFFHTVDLQERDPVTGKPIYSAKDVISSISSLGKVVAGLEELKLLVMKEREKESALRGSSSPGLFD